MSKKHVHAATNVSVLQKTKVKRVLGLWDLFAIGYGDLGSSIYYALGITALYALGATPLALLIAGVVFICTALSYAELSSIYHESGGSASYARHAFNDLISFIAGWGLLLDYVVTIAISAFAIAPYLAVFYAPLSTPKWHISISCVTILVLYCINVFGVKRSTRTSLLLALVAIFTQVLVIIIGSILLLNLPKVFDHMRIGVQNVDWSPSWPGFMHGVAMAMVAYTGIESIAQLGSESTKPQKNVPRAIFINMFALIIIYIGISTVGLSAVSSQALGTTYINDPLAGIAQALPFGKTWLPSWIGLLAAILLIVASNAGLMGSSRLAYSMGEFYQLPRFFSLIHPKFRTPHISLLIFALLAIAILIISRGQLSFLADVYNFGAMIAFFSTNLALLALRIKMPLMHRPYKTPFNLRICGRELPITAMIGCLATLSVWLLVVTMKPTGRYVGLAWMAVGIGIFLAYRRTKGLAAKGSLVVQKVKAPKFEPFDIQNILVPIQNGKDSSIVQLACELAKFHKANVTILHIIEVPLTVPIDAGLPLRTSNAGLLLQQAEAVARDIDVPVETILLRGRSFQETMVNVTMDKKYDLLIMGWKWGHEKIMRDCPCRIWLCAN